MRYKFVPIYKYAGVYIIKNQTTNKVYVGSSLNIEERLRGHRLALQRGNHPCSELQADYDALIEKVRAINPKIVKKIEYYYNIILYNFL